MNILDQLDELSTNFNDYFTFSYGNSDEFNVFLTLIVRFFSFLIILYILILHILNHGIVFFKLLIMFDKVEFLLDVFLKCLQSFPSIVISLIALTYHLVIILKIYFITSFVKSY